MDLIYNTYLDGERTQTEEGTRNKIKCGLMGVFIITEMRSLNGLVVGGVNQPRKKNNSLHSRLGPVHTFGG